MQIERNKFILEPYNRFTFSVTDIEKTFTLHNTSEQHFGGIVYKCIKEKINDKVKYILKDGYAFVEQHVAPNKSTIYNKETLADFGCVSISILSKQSTLTLKLD